MTQKMLPPQKIQVSIKILSGLRIGGDKEGIGKGENDNPIIKNPRTGMPYIPGSSVKGRMRALLEMQKYPQDIINGSPIQKPEHIIAKSFGCAIPTKIASRLLFSDWHLESGFINDFDKDISTIIETKQEVSIGRHLEGKDSNPRSIERINPGVIFSGTITLIPYEGELSTYNKNTGNYTTLKTAISEEELKEILIDGMNLIEQTYLGGYGSRGCGQVKFICPALGFTETDSPTS